MLRRDIINHVRKVGVMPEGYNNVMLRKDIKYIKQTVNTVLVDVAVLKADMQHMKWVDRMVFTLLGALLALIAALIV